MVSRLESSVITGPTLSIIEFVTSIFKSRAVSEGAGYREFNISSMPLDKACVAVLKSAYFRSPERTIDSAWEMKTLSRRINEIHDSRCGRGWQVLPCC